MSVMNQYHLVISLCTIAVSFMAFCINIITILADRAQRRIDNLVTVQQYLHSAVFSEARRSVRERQVSITLTEPNVRSVCSSFNFAGALVRNGAVNRRIFFDYWSIPIIALTKPLSAIEDVQTGEGVTVKQYYRDFWWLMDEARHRTTR
jgi:hypothetical protein